MFKYELATSLTLNIEKYCYSYLNGLADLWCLRGRCLPIPLFTSIQACYCYCLLVRISRPGYKYRWSSIVVMVGLNQQSVNKTVQIINCLDCPNKMVVRVFSLSVYANSLNREIM